MEATALSPSVFFDLSSEDGMLMENEASADQATDLVLPYISRMLMEEDTLYQQYDLDDPVLLKAQQPFMEIISNAVIPSHPCNTSVELCSQPLPDASAVAPYFGTESMVEANSFPPAADSSSMSAVSMALFKGMEEANKFLPTIVCDSEVVVVGSSQNQKKRHESEAEAGGSLGCSRNSKQMAQPLQPESEEEATAREMLDRLMINGWDPGLSSNVPEFHGAMANEETTMPQLPARRRRIASTKQAGDIYTLLIRCAEAMAANDLRGAARLLERIKHNSSPTGNGTQRLAHCFAKGLEARLAGTGSQIYLSLLDKRASMVSVLKAYHLFMASCSFVPVKLLFSNKTIYKAVAGRKKLHIVDYGLGHGVQWPDLLRWLSRRQGDPPEVRLTGIDNPQPGLCPARRIEETGCRLSAYARQFGVPFQFHSIANKSEAIHVEDLDIHPDEVLVVNSMFHLDRLMDGSMVVERPNPRDVTLSTIRKMRPSVFVHSVANGSHSSCAFFIARFRDALQRYAAMFDMMDTIAPKDDDRRLLVEQDMFARCATSIIACEGVERVERPQSYKQWQAQNRRAGLRQLPLDPEIVEALKDKVKKEYHKCFMISEDQRWLLQGWKGRVLFAISTWTADDDP